MWLLGLGFKFGIRAHNIGPVARVRYGYRGVVCNSLYGTVASDMTANIDSFKLSGKGKTNSGDRWVRKQGYKRSLGRTAARAREVTREPSSGSLDEFHHNGADTGSHSVSGNCVVF